MKLRILIALFALLSLVSSAFAIVAPPFNLGGGLDETDRTSGSSYASSTFSASPNQLILLTVACNNSVAALPGNPTLGGTLSATWTLVNSANFNGRGTVWVYRNLVTSLGTYRTGNVTVTPAAGETWDACAINVNGFFDVLPTGTNGADAIVQTVTEGVSGTSIEESGMAALSSTDNRVFAAIGGVFNPEDTTPGTNFSQIRDVFQAGFNAIAFTQISTNGTENTPSASWTTSTARGMVSIELADDPNVDADAFTDTEQRCQDLGSNCICAEAMNMPYYYRPGVVTTDYNPADSTSKECEFSTDAAISSSGGAPIPRNDSTALNALPSGHSMNYYFSMPDGGEGARNIGANTSQLSGIFRGRACARWYQYSSPDVEFAGEGATCIESKIFQFDESTDPNHTCTEQSGVGVLFETAVGGNYHLYNFTGFDPCIDCCGEGQLRPAGVPNVALNDLRGRWYRYEACVTNRDGDGPVFTIYAKNVTDTAGIGGGEDTLIVDSSLSPALSDTRTSDEMDKLFINLFRRDNCDGWFGISHLVVAGWDTDEGQRIGAAVEVEGTGISEVVSKGVSFSTGAGVQ